MNEITLSLLSQSISRDGKSMNLSSQCLQVISALIVENHPGLKSINLNQNSISQVDNMQFKLLEDCEIAFNELSGNQTFQCSSLIRLNLSFNHLNGIQLTSKNIQVLNLCNNNIAKVDFISNLRELRYLNLANNQITKVDFLVFNCKLQELYLQNNNITTLKQCMENVPALRILNVANNQIESCAFIDRLLNLEDINLSYNQLWKLDLNNTNENLNVLDISHNQIQTIQEIEFRFPYITHLYINSNMIMGEYDVQFITTMENIIEIDFRDNPYWNLSYENQFIVNCPWAELVNEREVGKPAAYIKQETLNLKLKLQAESMEEQNEQQINGDEEMNVITQERLKAILQVQGLDDQESDDEQQQLTTRSQVQDMMNTENEELQIFLTRQNDEISRIRQQYLSMRTQRSGKTEQSEFNESQQLQQQVVPQSPVHNNEEQQIGNGMTQKMTLGQLKPKTRQIITKTNGVSIPKSKQGSILAEIGLLKQSMKQKEFYQSMGFNQLQKNQRNPSQLRMNQSSENFNKQDLEGKSNRIKLQSATIKLPKI